MKRVAIILICLLFVTAIAWAYFTARYPETSPLKSMKYFAESIIHPHSNLNKYVLGFLPYWNLDDIQYIRPNGLSEMNYFSLSVNPDGHIATVANGQADPGWNGWEKQSTKDFITKSHIMGAKVTITIAAQENDIIQSVLNSNTAQENLISDILKLVKERNLDGVNIDFEYTGQPDAVYQQEFTYFSKKLELQLRQQNTQTIFSLSILPISGQQTGLYNFSQLAPIYDHFIGMSYDYYAQNASVAGPAAPMNGFQQGKYYFDVATTYDYFLKYLPKNKLLMGIPYYGWEWTVANGSTMDSTTLSSDTSSYAAIISYARYREDTDIKKNQCQWDTDAEETWCWFTDKTTGIDHQMWPMDNRAIQARFDYTNSQNFGGVAIWTLGLDKNYPDLWDKIQKTF